jgi:hypothetical protein
MLWYAGGMLAFQAERGALRDFALALFRYNRGLRLSETRPLGESGTEEALLSLLLP